MPRAERAIALRSKKNSLHPTQNNLPASDREQLVQLLNARLADALDLMLQCKQAHWNIKGPTFAALHELFDAAHDDARSYVDDIAERAAALGGYVDGTSETINKQSQLPAYPKSAVDGLAHAAHLARAMGAFGGATRAAIEAADALNDAVTADLFTSISRTLDKRMWMVEAHTQGG